MCRSKERLHGEVQELGCVFYNRSLFFLDLQDLGKCAESWNRRNKLLTKVDIELLPGAEAVALAFSHESHSPLCCNVIKEGDGVCYLVSIIKKPCSLGNEGIELVKQGSGIS